MKLLWNSNSIHVASGYGIYQKDLLPRLQKAGYEVAQIAFAGISGAPLDYKGIKLYPKMADDWGSDAMMFHSRHFGADVTFSMQDIWTLNPANLSQIRWIPYVPIDQDPIPEGVLDRLKYAHKIITFSKFGHSLLQEHGFVSTFIPEGTDVNIFKPLDKNECRKLFGLQPDQFVVGMVGANKENPPRKGWQQALEAFSIFHKNHPNAVFFFQTNQNASGGFPLQQYAKHLGIGANIRFIDEYLSTFHFGSEDMAKLYNTFDIYIQPSLSEGFGLCIIEAQACGVPVIVNSCQSMPELIVEGVTGQKCKVAFKFYTSAGGFFEFPDSNDLAAQMEKLFKADRDKMGKAARVHVVKNYNIDTQVKDLWLPYLKTLETEIIDKKT